MGKPTAEPQVTNTQTPISHFSHPHPLHLSILPPHQPFSFCSACKLDASGSLYSCTVCNFILHPKCYQLPKKIKHPFDQNHTLYLNTKPIYPEGLFNCDACGNQGDGFSYHCSPCGIDLHSICASLPLKFVHQCHHHELDLNFSSPYPGNSFSCDICKRVSSKTWLYRCTICEFDVHLTCVMNIIPRVSSIQQNTPHMIRTRSAPQYSGPPIVMGQQVQNYPFGATPYSAAFHQTGYGRVSSTPVNGGIRDQLIVGVANGVASGVAQSASQVLLQGMFGGGGGGGGGGNNVDAVSGGDVMIDGGMDGGFNGGDGSY